MNLVDAHVHLQMPPLLAVAEAVVARARQAGVRALVVNGTSPADWPAVAELAGRYPEVIPCFGVHPWEVANCGQEWESQLERHLDALPSAIGEVGLDRWIEPRDEALQERIFLRQLRMARQRSLPLMVHCLRAWDWLDGILAAEGPLPAGFLLHAYGGPPQKMPHFAAQGAYFSFSGSTFEPKRVKLREALKAAPGERLLLETDAPAMLPPLEMHPHFVLDEASKPANEPANLQLVYQAAADLRQAQPQELQQQVWVNAREFLGKLLHAADDSSQR